MDLTFDGTIELNTVLTPGSYQLESESRIISPLFTIKAPIIKTEDKVYECVFVCVCVRERERERERERGGEGRRRERKAMSILSFIYPFNSNIISSFLTLPNDRQTLMEF